MNLYTVNIQKEIKNFEKKKKKFFFDQLFYSLCWARTHPGEKFSITIFLI